MKSSYFQQFVSGVTGPYMFAAGVTTFLVSKEIWVLEHEFYCGLAIAICLGGIVKATGADLSAALDKAVDAEEAKVKSIRQDEIDRCKAAIAEEENSQWMATSYQELMEAKKENVGLQLELEYRSRLNDAYKQVNFREASLLAKIYQYFRLTTLYPIFNRFIILFR